MEREPVVGQYRGHALYAGGPPVSTGIQLFESLQILENYQPRSGARTTTDADYFHYLLESWKVRDQIRRVSDPERFPVEFAEHLTAGARQEVVREDRSEEGFAPRAAAARRCAQARRPDWHRDDVVCRRGC